MGPYYLEKNIAPVIDQDAGSCMLHAATAIIAAGSRSHQVKAVFLK
jgi:hypothetical protein